MKYSKLSKKAKKRAQEDYLKGWRETHPNDPFGVDELHEFLLDTNGEIDYNPDGTLQEN